MRIFEDSIELAGKLSRGDPMKFIHTFVVAEPKEDSVEGDEKSDDDFVIEEK